MNVSPAQQNTFLSLLDLAAIRQEKERRAGMAATQFAQMFPDEGAFRRELYPKHLDFFRATGQFRETAFVAANRVGKTLAGAYATACHLTGRYPSWWEGKRFDHPVQGWAAGDTSKTVRDILQKCLLGDITALGTGMIPADTIARAPAKRAGLTGAVETIWVRHVAGGYSTLVLKSYDQRRESFQGTAQHFIWLDEETPEDIYTECLIRTTTTSGIIYLTFTPLMGLSEVVLKFMPGGQVPDEVGSRAVITCTWDEVPHLSEQVKAELYESIPPHQRDARIKGIPSLGSGAIYPIPEQDIVVNDFQIPEFWPRVYGLDIGWRRTAAVWGAIDRDNDILYLYGEHYRGEAEAAVHVASIKGRGEWIPGVIDPVAKGRNVMDGVEFIQGFRNLGLKLEPAVNAVQAGISQVFSRMCSGKLKVFASLGNWRQEFRLYRRDDKGQVVKVNDHLMDATRYLVMSGIQLAKTKAEGLYQPVASNPFRSSGPGGWMA